METSDSSEELVKDSSASCGLDAKSTQIFEFSAPNYPKRVQKLATVSEPGERPTDPELQLQRDPVFKQTESEASTAYNAYETAAAQIKEESELGCKECVLCAGRADDTFDIYLETTCCGQVSLWSFICKVADLTRDRLAGSDFVCYSCFELINFIERAEIEFKKQRDLLLDIISQNPALAQKALEPFAVEIEYFKSENCKSERRLSSDDDEPLACIKPTRQKQSKASLSDDRKFSSDEDFCWKEEKKEDIDNISVIAKKLKIHRRKELKKEVDNINLPTSLEDDLKESTTTKKIKIKKYKDKPKKSSHRKRKSLGTAQCSNEQPTFKCTQCTRMFSKKGYLDQHMEKHKRNPKPYICEVCGKRFKYRKLCDAHSLMHRGIADWKCVPCNKLFPTKVAFLRHDKIHNGIPKYQCDLCGKSFIHYSSLRNHKIAHAGIRKYTCDQCGLALLSNASLTRHKLVHSGEKKYDCEVCGKKFARNSNMRTHMKTHAKEKGRPRRTPPPDVPGRRKRFFRCEICPEQFDRLFKLECHLVDDHNVHLKKGRPKPRNTMKKMQRAQQAAASMVNAIATAMGSRKSLTISFKKTMESKPSASSMVVKMSEAAPSGTPTFKTSPQYTNSMSPGTSYMSPPQVTADPVDYQDHHHPALRSVNALLPQVAYSMGAEYLGRMPDYSH